jgi:hypothetical protein
VRGRSSGSQLIWKRNTEIFSLRKDPIKTVFSMISFEVCILPVEGSNLTSSSEPKIYDMGKISIRHCYIGLHHRVLKKTAVYVIMTKKVRRTNVEMGMQPAGHKRLARCLV